MTYQLANAADGSLEGGKIRRKDFRENVDLNAAAVSRFLIFLMYFCRLHRHRDGVVNRVDLNGFGAP